MIAEEHPGEPVSGQDARAPSPDRDRDVLLVDGGDGQAAEGERQGCARRVLEGHHGRHRHLRPRGRGLFGEVGLASEDERARDARGIEGGAGWDVDEVTRAVAAPVVRLEHEDVRAPGGRDGSRLNDHGERRITHAGHRSIPFPPNLAEHEQRRARGVRLRVCLPPGGRALRPRAAGGRRRGAEERADAAASRPGRERNRRERRAEPAGPVQEAQRVKHEVAGAVVVAGYVLERRGVADEGAHGKGVDLGVAGGERDRVLVGDVDVPEVERLGRGRHLELSGAGAGHDEEMMLEPPGSRREVEQVGAPGRAHANRSWIHGTTTSISRSTSGAAVSPKSGSK